tara:strand:+ start:2169 stop:2330 length:162 start_codon:yes stop_codon:yes gene_type:complete
MSESKDEEVITIPLRKYNHLVERDDFLDCLEAAGVDNWSGWDDACEMYESEEE